MSGAEQLGHRCNDAERLQDLLDIATVKARYTRFIDTKCWREFAELFTEDAVMQMGEDESSERRGREAIVALLSQDVGEVHTLHRVFPGEITFTDDHCATAIWPMIDEVETKGFELRGHGFYREEYCRLQGQWYIKHWRLLRVRLQWKPKSLMFRMLSLLYRSGLLKLFAPDAARQFAQSFDPPLVRGSDAFAMPSQHKSDAS